ncbi:MAG TPA: helix-turn-helix domain-containing protein [Candidatus Woesebacteria bacterium]|nr:helix-turn-helix domain-containing protein [Candidatus Woesebacteria bacterium]
MKKNISVKEAAKRLGYSRNSIYTFLRQGLIRSVRIRNGKFRIPEEEIDQFQKVKSSQSGGLGQERNKRFGGEDR